MSGELNSLKNFSHAFRKWRGPRRTFAGVELGAVPPPQGCVSGTPDRLGQLTLRRGLSNMTYE